MGSFTAEQVGVAVHRAASGVWPMNVVGPSPSTPSPAVPPAAPSGISSGTPAQPAPDMHSAAGIAAAYRDMGRPLFRFALRSLGDRGRAEDAVQETFVRAWRAADRFDAERAPLGAWLFTICRNVVIDMARARKVRPVLAGADTAAAPLQAGEDRIDELVSQWTLYEALGRIGAEHRHVLVQVLLRDRSQESVAAELGVPVGTVKSRVFYGLRNLRKALHEMGWTDG